MDRPKTVGVVGAGQMGAGIAQVVAQAGYRVTLYDTHAQASEKALLAIGARLERNVTRGRLGTADAEAACARLSSGADLGAFSDTDLIIEAAPENFAIKQELFSQLATIAPDHCVFASNTSSISITRLGAACGQPERLLGMHFMNPVPLMPLIELIAGRVTDAKVLARAQDFAASLGKTVVVAADYPAFILNRILLPMINEAIFALYEGVGGVEAIDKSMELGANHPMGPLRLADMIGLDTVLAIMRVLYEGFGDTKYRPCPLLVQRADAGWLGRKTGRGFYDYSQSPPRPLD